MLITYEHNRDRWRCELPGIVIMATLKRPSTQQIGRGKTLHRAMECFVQLLRGKYLDAPSLEIHRVPTTLVV